MEFAREQAIERGRHLIEARYGCADCHGENLGGGVMIDAAPMGRLYGPNLTGGPGSRVGAFTPEDWDRIVRHGVTLEGARAVMPSQDFQAMSDQELGDIITYIESLPDVDNEVPPVSFGPIGKVLLATGQMIASYDIIQHRDAHEALPPEAAANVEFGSHLANTCTGCHGQDFSGGPIVGGDPSWAPARNLTPHPDALGGWSLSDFTTAMKQGVRPDGTELLMPMTLMMPFANNMTDVEIEALWVFLQSIPAVAPEG